MASLEAVPHQHLVQTDGHFRVADAATGPPETKDQLKTLNDELDDLQRILYAHDRYAVLLVFQVHPPTYSNTSVFLQTSTANRSGKTDTNRSATMNYTWHTTEQ